MPENRNINIYENFGEVQGQEKDVLVYVKDGNTYLLDPNLKFVKDAVIIDNIAGKEYQTVLGVDGKLYDLKTELNYPKGFVNNGIKYISNNIDSNSTNVLVEYKDGSIVMFDYRTGELLLSDESLNLELENVKVESSSILDFVKKNVNLFVEKAKDILNIKSSSEKGIEIKQSYEEGLQAEKFIEEKYVNENKIDVFNSENDLKLMYNSETNEYEVYNIDEILNGKDNKVTSETAKVKEELGISNLSAKIDSSTQSKIGINSIILFVTIVACIYFSIYRLYNKRNG